MRDVLIRIFTIIWSWSKSLKLNVECNRSLDKELKQTRTSTAVNKQLHFIVKKKPHATEYILLFEGYFMTKLVWKNFIDCFQVILE